MARTLARADAVDHAGLLEFVRPRHQMILSTIRSDGRPQMSPVTGGVDDQGRIVISTYPARAKAANLRRTPVASVVVLSDEFAGAWVQIDGDAEVIDMPDAEDALVDYYRSIAGERLGRVPGSDAPAGQVADPHHPDAVGSDRDGWFPRRRRGATRRTGRLTGRLPSSQRMTLICVISEMRAHCDMCHSMRS